MIYGGKTKMIVYLKTINGIKVQCTDTENKLLQLNNDISIHKILDRNLEEMKYVILNNQLLYPKLFYTEYFHILKNDHKDLFKEHGLRHDITIMSGNLAGIEFMKTYGHYHDLLNSKRNTAPEVIEILYGQALILLQKPKMVSSKYALGQSLESMCDFSHIEEFTYFKLNKGDVFVIPPGYGHILINQKPGALIFSSLISSRAKSLYKSIFDFRGGAYYIIKKNAKQVFVQNPNYKNVPKVKKQRKWAYSNLVDKKDPIYLSFVNDPKKYHWLNNPDSINWENFA